MTPDVFPRAIRERIEGAHGPIESLDRPGGMSTASVYRVVCARDNVIIKVSRNPYESNFYETVAPGLREADVPVVHVEWIDHLDGEHWIAMEALVDSLEFEAGEEWEPNPAIVAALVRLHRYTHANPPALPKPRRPRWTPEFTEAAALAWPEASRPAVEALMRRGQPLAEELDEEWCWISGDASPANWGVRADGSLAWFDWETFRPGMPAADLAPPIPGMPPWKSFEVMAAAYAREWEATGGGLPWDERTLARQIAIAKAATVVVLLAAAMTGAARVPEFYSDQLVAGFAEWLEGMSFI